MAKHAGGRPPKYNSVKELQEKIKDYFDSCWIDKVVEVTDKNGTVTATNARYQDRPYTVAGLALALDVTRETLCEWEKNSKFSDVIKKAKLQIKMNVEEKLLDGKNPAGCIFWLKNHDSAYFKDKTETAVKAEVKHGLSPEVTELFEKVYKKANDTN